MNMRILRARLLRSTLKNYLMSATKMITDESTRSDLLSLALAARAAHVCTIPASEDGEKKPALDAWKVYQERLPTEQELQAWFRNGRTGLGVVCGAVSGDLEVIDFDN